MNALSHVRVLDLTNVLAGPFCCHQLAHMGADVIKVEVPGSGDLARQLGADPELNAKKMGISFLAQNAGKRSITINLKSESGKRIFRELVKTADVVVENFRPGVMEIFDNHVCCFDQLAEYLFTALTFKIKNQLGQEVFSSSFLSGNDIILDFNDKPGVYFLTVKSERNIFTRKLIVK